MGEMNEVHQSPVSLVPTASLTLTKSRKNQLKIASKRIQDLRSSKNLDQDNKKNVLLNYRIKKRNEKNIVNKEKLNTSNTQSINQFQNSISVDNKDMNQKRLKDICSNAQKLQTLRTFQHFNLNLAVERFNKRKDLNFKKSFIQNNLPSENENSISLKSFTIDEIPSKSKVKYSTNEHDSYILTIFTTWHSIVKNKHLLIQKKFNQTLIHRIIKAWIPLNHTQLFKHDELKEKHFFEHITESRIPTLKQKNPLKNNLKKEIFTSWKILVQKMHNRKKKK